MKCPVCGSENKASSKACIRCGTKLATSANEGRKTPSLWDAPRPKRATRSTPPFWNERPRDPRYEERADFVVLGDDSTSRQKLRSVKDGQEINAVVPPEPPPPRESVKPGRYRVNWRRLVASVLLILVVSSGVSYGGYMGYKAAVRFFSQWVTQHRGEGSLDTPLVEKVLVDGQVWHRITFYGKDGEQVLVDDPRRSLPIQNGKAELLLDDDSYIPDDLSGSDTKKVMELKATIFSPNNRERTVTVDPYTIDIPLSPLKLIEPKEQGAETSSNRVTIKVKVTPGSRVIIGSNNATDRVNADGMVSSTVALEAKGMNFIKITVETKKHRRNAYELQVNRPVLAVPIVLSDDMEDSTSDPTIEVSGSTAPGADVTTDATLSGGMNLDKSTGVFSFRAKLRLWGWNAISLTATDGSGKTSTLVCMVNHVPALEGYTKQAWPMDYAYLSASTESLLGQVYVCEGMVTEKLQDDETDRYLFNIGTSDDPKNIVLEYAKESTLKVGQYYKLYADVIGTQDGYPVLSARFAYEKDTPSGYGEAPTKSPESTDTSGQDTSDDTSTQGDEQ